MDKRFKQNIILRSLGVILLLSIFTMAIKSPTAAITYAQEGNTATPTVVSTLDTTLIECVLHKVDAHFSEITVDVVVSDIKMDGNWAFGIVVIKATTLNDSPALFLFNAYHEKTGWIVALEMEEMFNVFLNQIPVSLVSIESKQFMVREADNGEYHQLAGNEEAQLSLPWDTGQSWKLTGGPHMNSINSTVWSALDFQGPNSSGVVRAAQSGVVWRSSGCLNFIRVDHSDGWQTGYYHLLNERVSNGQTVSRGQALGDISTASGCGGSASGPHVHFSLRRNGVEQKIDGHDIGGWTVHNGTAQYNGYMVRVSDGARVNQWGTIYNDGSIGSGADTTPPTKASNVHPNGWTGPYTSDSTPSFMWNAAIDDDSGVAGYYVAVDDWTPEGGLSTDWWVGNVTTYTIPSALFDGQHFFAVTSKDNEGNRNPTNTNVQGDAPYYTFYVDTHSPSGSFNINNGDYVTRTTQVSIYSAVTDAVSGVVEMRLRNAGASWGNWQTYRSRVTHLLPATTGQNYTVEVQYRDRVGNTSSTYSQSILLNLYPDRPSSTNYNLLKSTTGNSVWNHQSNNYQLLGTSGQPSPAGQMNSPNYQLESGYWASNSVPSCTFSGTIDLQGRSDDNGATFIVVGSTAGTFSTNTDASGYYELTVPEDTYDITAETGRYLDGERTGEVCPAGGVNQPPQVTLLGGDTNDDCVINILDLSFMGARFMTSAGDAGFDSKADINADDAVNILDLTMVGANFWEECPVDWP